MSLLTAPEAAPARAPQAPVGSPNWAGAVPWYVWAVIFASTSVVVGVIWDISWHRTIGRDTFWTPAHMAIYLGGATAGLSCGWLVLRTTFAGTVDERSSGVTFWGFRGPLGAWVCIWGALAMIASGPFDDWWHNAYGLDVQILSPPHTVLASGIIAIQIGAMLMVLSRQNNAGSRTALPQFLFAYAGGVLLVMMATLATEQISFPNSHRGTQFYLVSAGIFPVLLAGISRSSLLRWGATTAAAFYMGVTIVMLWILQLFSAQPLLGPILRSVDHMVPPAFPLLLVAPAFAVDLIVGTLPQHRPRLRTWLTAVAVGTVFLAVLLAVQWFFAGFLISEGAHSFVFGAQRWDYYSAPGPWQYEFWDGPPAATGLAWAALIGVASARVGLWWGDWMSRVRR
jgi:hypothetical protein